MAEGGPHPHDGNIEQVTDKLQLYFNNELGRGLQSTVYKGKFENIPVAVKKIKFKNVLEAQEQQQLFKNSRERDIMNILEGERHKNIIGYYVSEIKEDIMYIALELCQGNLRTYVNSKHLKASYPAKRVNRDIASGVDFLHSRNIAHRDIKPENVYFVSKDSCITRIVIGDFGTSKCTIENMCTVSGSIGTFGYIAAEVMDIVNASEDEHVIIKSKMSTKSDIFSLGCVFYFTVTDGLHPFGKGFKMNSNIQNRFPPTLEACIPSDDPLKQLLIEMLSHNQDVRPTAREVREHPALWSPERALTFLSDASEELMNYNTDKRSQVENPDVIRGGNWMSKMPINLKTHLENYEHEINGRRVYIYRKNNTKVFGLLRTIRNVCHHYTQFPPEVLEDLGRFPEGHAQFWMKLCPLLLMHVYRKVKDGTLTGDDRYISAPQPTPEMIIPTIESSSSESKCLTTHRFGQDTNQTTNPGCSLNRNPEMIIPTIVSSSSESNLLTMHRFGQNTNQTTNPGSSLNRYPAKLSVYNENQESYLPMIGSRVTLGPDLTCGNQDSNVHGTIIGHAIDDNGVYVEWDKDGSQGCYRYGHETGDDILLSDKAREVSKHVSLKVGNVVTLGEDIIGLKKGVVVRMEDDGLAHVRWPNGDRGNYSFGVHGVYDVWPWNPKETTTTKPYPDC